MLILFVLIASLAGASASFGLSHYAGWNKVLASALPSFLVYLVFKITGNGIDPQLTQMIPAAFMGASFCGMSAPPVIASYRSAAVSGIFFGLIFTSPVLLFNGFGGALGTMACISVFATAGLRRILMRFNISMQK